MEPTREELEEFFQIKYGDPDTTGWGPRMRFRFGHFTPDDIYESIVLRLVHEGCSWVDVGSGRDIFPSNPELAKILADRCEILVGVDPSNNIDENPFIHEGVKSTIDQYRPERQFDLATLRMVVEHITEPEPTTDSLSNIVKPGGKVVIYTVNRWSPVTIISHLTPFWLHNPIKRILWQTEEKDTFPVVYRMNTRKCLAEIFERSGFNECYFTYLDDCRVFSRFRFLKYLELSSWRLLNFLGIRYPENCLLGIYERKLKD